MALTKLNTSSLPAGSVLQVKQGETSAQVIHSTASYSDTGLSVSITPTSPSSKILVIVNQHRYRNGTGGGAIRLVRAGAVIFEDSQRYQSYGDEAANRDFHNMQYLDSPNTTSEITYKTQGRTHSGVWYTQEGNHFVSRIIVMEIAG